MRHFRDHASHDDQASALSEFTEASTVEDAARSDRVVEGPFVKLSNRYAGMCLDHGLASSYAIHLAVIKLGQGDGYVNNEKRLLDRYGIRRRAFRSGNRLLRKVKLLDRSRNGGKPSNGRRRFASEKWLVEAGEGFVPVPEKLIEQGPKVVGLYVAICLSPGSTTPAAAGKRIGLSSINSVRPLLDELEGHIAIERPAKGEIRVARIGHIFDDVKKWPSKKLPGKNGPTHSRCTNPQKKEGRTPKDAQSLSYGTGADAPGARVDSVCRTQVAPPPDWKPLTHWEKSARFQDVCDRLGWCAGRQLSGDEEIMKPQTWRYWLDRFGGGPGHVYTDNARRQAAELAVMLADDQRVLSDYEAMIGVAWSIAAARANGNPINSLGFIAANLVRRLSEDDLSWAREFPSALDGQAEDAVRRFAEECLDVLSERSIDADRDHLRSTLEIERLFDLARKHGVAAFRASVRQAPGPEEDRCVWGWSFFEVAIEEASNQIEKTAQRM